MSRNTYPTRSPSVSPRRPQSVVDLSKPPPPAPQSVTMPAKPSKKSPKSDVSVSSSISVNESKASSSRSKRDLSITRLCNTCQEEKPIKSFADTGYDANGDKYKSRKCRKCLTSKVNPTNDDDSIRKMKLQSIDNAVRMSERLTEMISNI
jgi:hypothetical protein